jgi:hypothetical protein
MSIISLNFTLHTTDRFSRYDKAAYEYPVLKFILVLEQVQEKNE